METDDALVETARRAREGDTRAFDRLVLRHQERVLANCRYLSGSPDDAEDLAQAVFVKAYFALPRFEGRSTFGTWVQRIKINHCLNYLRGKKRRSFVDLDEPEAEALEALQVAPEQHRAAEGADERTRIRAVLDRLPEALRVPLLMRDLDGLAYQEIAGTLGIGLSAVKMRIKRGREEFRRLYDGEPGGRDRRRAGPPAGPAKD